MIEVTAAIIEEGDKFFKARNKALIEREIDIEFFFFYINFSVI